ncbi:MAG TPA: BamA/TamA family outer membrane protein, partial [candidate division Zixibacteria bacterium]|nr:BamA/TamA family outer membrane protein [candidate division Zixibacteria bacterium]
ALGKSLEFLGSEREDWYFSTQFRWGWKISSRQYLLFLNQNESYLYKQNFDRVKNYWRLTYFNKSLPSQTIALGLNLSSISRQVKYRQITLGGDLGLRGYEINEFSGQKQILLNLEDRIFTPVKILTVALGAVVFFDAGYLWENESHINLKDLRTDVGVGLRLGFTKALAGRVARFDLAKALHEDRYFISLGVGQVFGW